MSPVLDARSLRFLPRPAQNQFRQLREQSELLELVEPGAPARAHVLVDSPKPADSPILVRGQAETPGEVVPRRFLEVLSGTNRPHFRERQRTARARQRDREQDQPADRARDGQSRLAASFRRRLRQHARRSRQPVVAADASGAARLAREPVHGRRLVGEEAAQADSALGNLAAEQPQQPAIRGEGSVQPSAVARQHPAARVRAAARFDSQHRRHAGSDHGRPSGGSLRRHARCRRAEAPPRQRSRQRRQPAVDGSAPLGVRLSWIAATWRRC